MKIEHPERIKGAFQKLCLICVGECRSPKEELNNWEERFDEKFPILTGAKIALDYHINGTGNHHYIHIRGLKDFIEAELSTQLTEIREKVEKLLCRGEAVFDDGTNDIGLSRKEVLQILQDLPSKGIYWKEGEFILP